jgi:hypothetical protein
LVRPAARGLQMTMNSVEVSDLREEQGAGAVRGTAFDLAT